VDAEGTGRRCLLDGRETDPRRIVLDDVRRAFLYGDGIFETILARRGRLVLWTGHWRRMAEAAAVVGLTPPPDPAAVRAAIEALLRSNGTPEAAVRLTLWRAGPAGFDPGGETAARWLVESRPYAAGPFPSVRCVVSALVRRDERSVLSRIKTVSYAGSVLARREARAAGFDEALLLNGADDLAEASAANLFFVRRGAVYTPSVECGILPGIVRAAVLGLCRAAGFPAEEGRYRPSDLAEADEVFLTNSLRGVVPAVEVRGLFARAPGPAAAELSRRYGAMIEEETHG